MFKWNKAWEATAHAALEPINSSLLHRFWAEVLLWWQRCATTLPPHPPRSSRIPSSQPCSWTNTGHEWNNHTGREHGNTPAKPPTCTLTPHIEKNKPLYFIYETHESLRSVNILRIEKTDSIWANFAFFGGVGRIQWGIYMHVLLYRKGKQFKVIVTTKKTFHEKNLFRVLVYFYSFIDCLIDSAGLTNSFLNPHTVNERKVVSQLLIP